MLTETNQSLFLVFEISGQGELYVLRQCPDCGRFITTGRVLINGLDQLKLPGWQCKKHGEVKPFWEWAS